MACGTDRAGVIGRACRPGMLRLAEWIMGEFGAGSLGCFNPKSKAGGIPSLHADGRGFDAAFDGHTREGWDAGWRCFTWCIDNADRIGLQEILFGGYLWSCQNRHLGIRGPGIQQPEHMNHVHIGVTYHTADNFQLSWVNKEPEKPKPPAQIKRSDRMLLARNKAKRNVLIICEVPGVSAGVMKPIGDHAYLNMARAGVSHVEDLEDLEILEVAQYMGVKF